MTLRHMNIFHALCENDCNTTKTAEALNMTQPAVSQAIKEMEQYYGVMLFDRVGRKLVLTKAGELLHSYAAHISALFSGGSASCGFTPRWFSVKNAGFSSLPMS